jgi:hypothetical protein
MSPAQQLGAALLRRNLIREMGEKASEAAGKHAHHWLPQQFRPVFEKLGLGNIDDAAYGSMLTVEQHKSLHPALNKAWEEWFLSYPNATKDDVLFAMEKFKKQFGF